MTAAEKLRSSELLLLMSLSSGLLPEQLVSIIQTAPLRYKTYKIPKRTGGFREIAQPAKEVKWLQRWLVEHARGKLPVHPAAAAYEPGCSIKKNALRHAGGRFLLRMDFKNFFPSITQQDLEAHLRASDWGISDADVLLIARTCLWARGREFPLRLCIGAPSSPFLSNSIMYEFDCIVEERVRELGVRYSRYADDLTFSCVHPDVLPRVELLVERTAAELTYPRLTINGSKTIHASKAGRRLVTGLIITPDGQISVGRDKKRLIRAMIHREVLGRLSDEEIRQLEGLVNFVASVEPDFRTRVANWRASARRH